MKVGLALPHYDFSFPSEQPATVQRVVDYARRAESLGFDSVWVSDHLFLDLAKYGGPPARYKTPEATAMLAALATATERVRFGSLVLCASFRHPVFLAAQLQTIHEASGGRLEVGLGAGWYEAEFNAAGIPFGSASQRIERLAVVAGQLDARLDPRPPLIVGGKGGPKVARVVAEHADGWNVCWRITPDEYRARLETLRDACARAKRDPESVILSVGLYTLLGTDRNDLQSRYEALQRWTPGGALDGVPLAKFAEGALVGTVEECAAAIKEFETLGVSEIILSPASVPFAVYDDEQLELAARELIPQVRG
ncbi:MAG TPA: LLM class flavin-dependent oxidoreductase [Actinomycetota bacterium]|nr:LLM class flavin-dependent oxidoreductase [Actinomycetota bacterium]